MNAIKSLEKLAEQEFKHGLIEKGSWHDQYKDSPYIFVGGLDFALTEGDLKTVFSQYGKVKEVNLCRDKETGASRGFAFLAYEDQRSTILAVDNFNGIKLAGRRIKVDHVLSYRRPEEIEAERDARRQAKTRYASLITEELFKTGSGDFLLAPVFAEESETLARKGSVEDKTQAAKTRPSF